MELEVLDTKGIPDTGVISIRAGSTRRQAQVSGLDRPMKFPQMTPQDCNGFKIDVLDLLGSARMSLDAPPKLSYEYNVDLEPANDQNTTPMQVTFTLRRSGEGGGAESATSDRDQSKEGTLASNLSFEKLDLNQDGVVTKEEFNQAMGEGKAEWVKSRETKARGYMEEHGLVGFMQYLMQSLMKDKPVDPYHFLQKQVAMRAAQAHMATSSEEGHLTALLKQLDPKATTVNVEQLRELEKEAVEAGEKLRTDNSVLRNTAMDLRNEYEKVLKESMVLRDSMIHQMELPAQHEGCSTKVEPIPGETPQLHAYREIALVQDEVCALAKENAALVEELSRMRSAVEAVRNEVGAITNDAGPD